MSKRIIDYGTNAIITCKDCGCKFVFEKEDVKDDKVTCPFCKSANTDYGASKIPMGGK
jgi:predicted Zn-ribbon and HTH transcriptional regulator